MHAAFSTFCVFLLAQFPLYTISSVLVRYPARTIRGSSSEACPSVEETRETRNQITSAVTSIIQTQIAPVLFPPCSTGGCRENPALFCVEIAGDNATAQSGLYWVESSNGSAVQVFCDMGRHCCNSTGGWVRVANLNMTDPEQVCPEDFTPIEEPARSCGKVGGGCVSTIFETRGIQYSKVCGRLLAYQEGEPDAFKPYVGALVRNQTLTLEDQYLDGVSITHGQNPRQHIWSFVAAHDEALSTPSYRICPCTKANESYTSRVPPFIEDDYFCDTGSREEVDQDRFYVDDPLWDGQGCGENSACCSWNSPPWFCKDLPRSTNDDIEVRLCSDSGRIDEHTPIELIELYVQ